MITANPTANTMGTWFKRWGWAIMLGVMVLAVVLTKVLPTPKNKEAPLAKAKKKMDDARSHHKAKLEVLKDEMDKRRKIVADIVAMDDEGERLKALAEFANKRNRGEI